MNWKHLFWIIPLALFIGALIGFKTFAFTIDTLDDMVHAIDECSMQTLTYAAEQNEDCQILISGYLNKCIDEQPIGVEDNG